MRRNWLWLIPLFIRFAKNLMPLFGHKMRTFLGCLALVLRQKPSTKPQRFQLHDRRQRKRMKTPESAVLVEKPVHVAACYSEAPATGGQEQKT